MCVCKTTVSTLDTYPEIRKHLLTSTDRYIRKSIIWILFWVDISLSEFLRSRKTVLSLYQDIYSFILKRVKTTLQRRSLKACNASFITYSVCCKYLRYAICYLMESQQRLHTRFSSRLHNFHQIVIKLRVCWLISRALLGRNTRTPSGAYSAQSGCWRDGSNILKWKSIFRCVTVVFHIKALSQQMTKSHTKTFEPAG